MKIYRKLMELRPEWTEKVGVVMTESNKDPEEWRSIIGNKHHRDEMATKFKNNDDPMKIAIVVDMWLTGFDVPSLATMYVYKPMSGHNLMQAIARVNRVYKDKEGGLVVDYVGIASALKQAMNDYTNRDKHNYGDTDIAKTALPKFVEKLEVCRDLFHGFDYSGFMRDDATDLSRAKAISGGVNFLSGIEKEKQKEAFIKEAMLLRQALSLCRSLLNPAQRFEAAFFEAVRTLLTRISGAGKPLSLKEINRIAKNLSEGERNFIAFLYFYHEVRGSSEESGALKPKIVVIDDPVSSLDSGVLFLVSSLVRELIDICYNNVNLESHTFKGNSIEQVFIMTHNTYFHREITYNQVGRYDFVTFFLIQKRSNISVVKPCIRENRSFVPPKRENYNPVQNSYKALWSELSELSGAITTMSVIRRILEYYFLQLCGYDGIDLRKEVLEKNQDRFIVKSEDEAIPDDDTKFHLAQSMLSYIGKQDHGFNDGIDYVDESTDVHEALEVFKIIFDCLDQIQHYNMMMDEVASAP